MKISRSLFNFAKFFCIMSALTFTACQGRTMENVVPTGETVEVVIASPVNEEEINN